MSDKHFGAGFDQLTDTSEIKTLCLCNVQSEQQLCIDNIPGKQASVKILCNIASTNNNLISTPQAELGLDLYGDYTQEELQNPNSHPNIRLLLDIIEHQQTWKVILEM